MDDIREKAIDAAAKAICHYGNAGAETNSCCPNYPQCRTKARAAIAAYEAALVQPMSAAPLDATIVDVCLQAGYPWLAASYDNRLGQWIAESDNSEWAPLAPIAWRARPAPLPKPPEVDR